MTQVKREQKHALIDLFAQAVVEKALEVERTRQCALRQSLEEICKAQRVRRIRRGSDPCLDKRITRRPSYDHRKGTVRQVLVSASSSFGAELK
ncbi:unnamed protein product [Dibothriocephalus latus]|uniref:Uncharacterized protein n=1 Tax=Dibothriocephalus latus TaxID=60516 RepID=A0A3P7N872_DIBLA|nr:unnamed protein product [Dibothriocephalus latus]